MFHSGHMHLLVYAIENDDCPIDAVSLEVVCFYLDTVGDDDYTLTKTCTPCLWRNWLVSQVIGSFSSPDWCVSWNAPRAAVSEALDALTSEEQRDIYKWQCLFQQDAHGILAGLATSWVCKVNIYSSHVQFFIVGIVAFSHHWTIVTFPGLQIHILMFFCLFGWHLEPTKTLPPRIPVEIYIYIQSWEAMGCVNFLRGSGKASTKPLGF